MATRRFFNSQFIKENNFDFTSLCILQDIYSWIFSSNSPEQLIFQGKKYFYLNQTYIASINEGLIKQSRVSGLFKFYKRIGIINSSIVKKRKYYVSFNWNKILESLIEEEDMYCAPDNNWYLKIHEFIKEELKREEEYKQNRSEDSIMLFEFSEKPKYTKEAEMITRRIITKYHNYFPHRLPKENEKPTKLFIESCKKIQDIYNGTFTNSKYYRLSRKFLCTKQFDTDNWRGKIDSVKGDWCKVRKLLFKSIENFILMFDTSRMPFKKDFLQKNLNTWLYDPYTNKEEPQSQFILCLNEPRIISKQLSENKADAIFEKLSPKVQDAGNRLFELAGPQTPSGTFWKNIEDIVCWTKHLLKVEENVRNWISSSSQLLNEFADYCERNKITISSSTLDIEKAVKCNGPWVWFIKDAIEKNKLNKYLCLIVTKSDFDKYY